MAITFVKCTEIETGLGAAASGAVTATAGNQLIALVAAYSTPTSLTMSGGGTWTTNYTGTLTSSMRCFTAICLSATGGSQTITATVSGGGGVTVFILEFSGITSYEGGGTTATGTSTGASTNALTNTQATALKLAVCAIDTSNITAFTSTGTGWTLPTNGQAQDGTTSLVAACGYKIVSASQSDTETWSRAGSSTWIGDIVTYLDAPGKALSFNGSSQYASAAHNAEFNLGGNFTIEFWVKGSTQGNFKYLMAHTDGSGHGFAVYTGGNGDIYAYFGYGSAVLVTGDPGASPWDNTWRHFAFVLDTSASGNWALYGTPTGGGGSNADVAWTSQSAGSLTMSAYTGTLYVGSYDGTQLYFGGQLDDVRIWNVARTLTQINASKNAELVGNETGLVAYWKFNEGSGTTAADATATAENLTLSGATWVTGYVPTSGGGASTFNLSGSVTQAQSLSLKRAVTLARSVTQAQALSIKRAVTMSRSLVQTQALSVRQAVQRTLAVAQAQSLTIAAQRVFLRTVSATQAQAVTLVKRANLSRSVAQAQALSLVQAQSLRRTLAITQAQVALLVKQPRLARAVTQGQSITIAAQKVFLLSLTVTQAQAVTLVRRVGLLRLLTQAQTPSITITPIIVTTTPPALWKASGDYFELATASPPTYWDAATGRFRLSGSVPAKWSATTGAFST